MNITDTDTNTLDALFGGGPELPATHWIDRYAKASAERAALRLVIAELADAATAMRNDGMDRLEWIRKTAFAALDKQALNETAHANV